MLSILIGIPLILLAFIFQSVVVSTLSLLHGTADLLLLISAAWALQNRLRNDYSWAIMAGLLVGAVSHTLWVVPLVAYGAVTVLANFLRRQVWQTPLLAMMVSTLVGSLLLYALEWATLVTTGVSLPLSESLNLVVLPSTLLNLLLAIPVYALVTELYQSVFPEEVAV
jgi:hypothetical protein